ncbi:hypothetical protein ABMA70_11085 [Halobacteriovorax sp. XZX-3]|uniref:hypothetical protein n=1 Tax=unclassified Halobacteriovorax TaxID=2639665 RepID=UPI000CD01120|nr:hypothetical protein [Halobacteriovorax sp. DA5]POB13880.1 hypothetical protein C0Z22_07415 [Halobacteriovorax sp. DA5]
MLRALTLFSLLTIVSCGPISMDRQFLDVMGEEDEGFSLFSPGKAFDTVGGDPSYVQYSKDEMMKRTPSSEEDYPSWSQEKRLKMELQGKLDSMRPEDREAFRRKERMFDNDSQKLYYLTLTRAEQQEYGRTLVRYEKQRKFEARKPASIFRYSPRAQAHREIAMGMDKKNVIDRWGNPHRVDTAGNPQLENERWTFFENGERKFVYFSQGKVEGWSLE